jgi:hypothetical protein
MDANHTMNEYAHFERVASDMLEIRLKPGVRVDQACIASIMRERVRCCGSAPLCVLVIASDDAELDIAVLGMDHYQVNQSSEGLRAVAITSGTLMLETMARLYAAYFPPMFRLEVFSKEADAREWLNGQVAELRRAEEKA